MAGSKHYDVVVVGGGNSAGYLCKTLVDLKWKGSLALVSREPVAPYERPALTKAFLHPPSADVRARLPGFHTSVGGGGERQTPEWYKEHGFELLLNTTARDLDLEGRSVTVANADGGEQQITFDKLVLATGARALSAADLKMQGADLGNVFTIREEHETHELVRFLENKGPKKLFIVGGGYIAMETAAALSGWGLDVTMAYPEQRLMERLLPPAIAKVFEACLGSHGVKMMPDTLAKALEPKDGESGVVGAVALSSGDKAEADVVVMGVGARLNTEVLGSSVPEDLANDAGGVKVDDGFETPRKDVFAIGDLAAVEVGSKRRRFEHVDFCRKSAKQCATKLATGEVDGGRFEYMPYFYSRLFEYTDKPLVFQFYGDSSDTSNIELLGDVAGAEKAAQAGDKVPVIGAAWVTDGHLAGAMLVNASQDQYAALQKAVADKAPLSSLEGLVN